MRSTTSVIVTTLLLSPVLASASCFSVYSVQDKLVYQSTVNPIDLSLPISQALKPRFAGQHLTMDPNEASCTEIGPGSASSRFDPRDAARNSMATGPLGASPVTRDSRAPLPTSVGSPSGDGSRLYGSDPGAALRDSAGRAPRRR